MCNTLNLIDLFLDLDWNQISSQTISDLAFDETIFCFYLFMPCIFYGKTLFEPISSVSSE